MKYETHSAADIFPMMSEAEYEELKAEISLLTHAGGETR
jgi:hypothetical protein